MDRAQPGARGLTNRNIEFGETTGQYTDGWIVSADEPTLSSQRYISFDETAFNEFDATYSADSLTVTIDPGEAFVDGWLARDEPTDVDLAADTVGQQVVVGWDPDAIYDDQQHDTRDEADRVIVGLESNVDATYPVVVVWEFDTDDIGVVDARDIRTIGQVIDASIIRGGTLAVDNPARLPIAELADSDSIELAIPTTNNELLEIYRWGSFDASTGSAPDGLYCDLLDGSDMLHARETKVNSQESSQPIA